MSILQITSIQTRLMAAVSLLIIAIIGGIIYAGLTYFEIKTKELIAAQQFLTVTLLADDIDDKLQAAHKDVISLAKLLAPEHLADADQAQEFLNRYTFMPATFTNGFRLFDKTGALVAETPFQSKNRRGGNFAFREFFTTTVARGEPYVGDPYISSREHQHPVITLTAPVFDGKGALVGVLGGSIDLLADNGLSHFTSMKIGKTGYFYLATSDRQIILHPDQSRILNPQGDIPKGSNVLFEQAIAGFEGTGETVTSRGLQAITSFKHLQTKSWIVGANFSKEEAYAPILQARRTFLQLLAVAILLVTLAAWYLMNSLIRPLLAFTRHVAGISEKKGEKRVLPVTSVDEIGRLTQAFNTMVADLDGQRLALQASEQKYRQIIEMSHEGILLLNQNFETDFLNVRLAVMLGYQEEEMLGQPLDTFLYPEDHVDQRLKRGGRQQGVSEQYERRWRHKDGHAVWTIVSAMPLFDDQGQFCGSFAMVLDITERKRAEDELQRYQANLEGLVEARTVELKAAKEAAETAHQAKSLFLSSMSHELRTPLNAILGYAQLLKSQRNLNDKQRQQLEIVYGSGEHLLNLINDILDVGKIEARKMEVEISTFNLSDLLQQVVNITRIKADEKDLPLLFETLTPLPRYVGGDERKLKQILLNLLSNSVKYSRRGKIILRVGYAQEGAGVLQCDVVDTGIGIPRDQLEGIFEPFSQLTTEGQHREGTGLGLTITKRLVDLLQGTLEVESEVGQGSTFRVSMHLPEVTMGHVLFEKIERAIVGYQGERQHILVVDDNVTNAAMLVWLLEPLGFAVVTAGTGEEALRRAQEHQPDLVLLDLVMPGMDGLETVQMMRRHPELDQTRIIGLSATVTKSDSKAAFIEACNAFLEKPCNIDDLLDVLEKQLDLVWVRGQENVPVAAVAPAVEGVSKKLPWEAQQELLELALRGDLRKIQARAAALEEQDGAYGFFAGKLRQLAEEFKVKAILDLIEQYGGEQHDQ